jgi:acyl carrier protein
MMATSQDVLSDVLAIIREMLNCPAGAVNAESRFFADLGLSSIDIIVVADRLEQHYSADLRFADALPELANSGIDDVTLGQLAALVELRLQQSGA